MQIAEIYVSDSAWPTFEWMITDCHKANRLREVLYRFWITRKFICSFQLYLTIEETLKRGSGWRFWGTLFFRKMNHLPDILNRVILIVWIAIQTYIGLWNKCLLLKWNTGLLRHFAVLAFGESDYFVRIKRHYSFTNFQPLLTKFNAVLPRTCLLRSTPANIRSS